MRDNTNLIHVKRKTFFYFLVILLAFITVTPVLAAYLGPNRTVTEIEYDCNVNLLSCQYVPSKNIYKYKPIDTWVCANESKPWLAYPSSGPTCWSGTEGAIHWEKVSTAQNVTKTYPPATIDGLLQNCTLNNGWCTTAPQVSLNGVEPVTGYEIIAIEGALNGQNFACPDDNCSVSLVEGDNSISYWAMSSFGDSSTMGTFSAKVDSQRPVLSGAYSGVSGSDGWYLSQVTFNGAASDSTSGLASFTCTLDGTALGSCTSISIDGEGTHTLVLSASDHAGNTNISEQTVLVDTKSPALNAAFQGVLGSNSWYNDVALHASATDPVPGSGLVSLEYNFDHAGWIAFPVSGILGLPDGTHVVDIRVSDLAGHLVSSSRSYSLDGVAPDVALNVAGTLGQNDWYVTPLDLSAIANDSTSGVDVLEYSLDNSPWTAYVQPLRLNDGSHAISWWAQDKAGLTTQVDRIYRVDTHTPQIMGSISGTTGVNGWYTSDVTISASTADPLPGSGIEAFTYTLDGSGESPYVTGLMIPDGVHTLVFNSKDKAGLTYSITQTVHVDTIHPSLSVSTAAPAWIKGSIQFSGTAGDSGSGLSNVEVSFNNGQSWQSVAGTNSWTYDWDTHTSTSGKYNVLIRATDKAGLTTEEKINTGVDNQVPNISLPSSWYQWETITLDVWDNESGLSEARVEISDPDGRWPKRVINLDINDFPLNFKWDRRFGDDTVAPNGLYDVEVIALDSLGNTKRQSASLRVLLDILPAGPTATPQPYSRAMPSATPFASATPTLLPASTPTPVVSVFGAVDATAQVTPTPVVDPPAAHDAPAQTTVLDWLESLFSSNDESTVHTIDFDTPFLPDSLLPENGSGVLWGATAAAMVGAVTGYALEERRKKEEERAAEMQRAETQAKRQAQKMEKLEAQWAQERAWEAARLEAQAEEKTAQYDVTTKYDREDALSDAAWTKSVTVMAQRAEEKKKADELKAGLEAYYSARKQGEQKAAEDKTNWWEKVKSYVSESILEPLDQYVYTPLIQPAVEKTGSAIASGVSWLNTNIYQPYIKPVVNDAKEKAVQAGSWLDANVYQPYIAPMVQAVAEAVSVAVSWTVTEVYEPYIVPVTKSVLETAQETIEWVDENIYEPYMEPVVEWANENIYQPYVQPSLAAIDQSIVQPFVVPFIGEARETIEDGAAWLKSNVYEPYIEPVVKDIDQYIVDPLTQKASDLWDEYGEWVHGALDAAGFVPGLGDIADGLSGLIYLAEGQYIEAGVSLIAMIPLVGDLAKAGKWGLKIGTEVVEEVIEEVAEEVAEKVAKEVAEEIAEKVVQETTENIIEEATEELAEKVAQETVEELLEKTAKETIEESSEKVLKETSEELVSKTLVDSVENTVEKVVKETSDDVVEKVVKETSEEVVEESAEQVSEIVTENVAQEVVDDVNNKLITLSTKFGNDSTTLTKVLALVDKYGENAIKAFDVVSAENVAKVLKNVDETIVGTVIQQSDDAFAAFAGWSKKELKEHAEELAERAVKDADVLKDVRQLIKMGPIDPDNLNDVQKELIRRIAENSTQNPSALKIVLGKWEGLDGGFIQQAKETLSTYYNPHPDVWNILEKLGTENQKQVAWLINQQVIKTSLESGRVVEYTLNGVKDIENEMKAIEAVFSGATKDEVNRLLLSKSFPFRMSELEELSKNGFRPVFNSIDNSYIIVKP